MDAKLRKWVCKVLPWFVGVLLTGLVSGTVLVTDGSIPVDLQGTQWMWLAAVMTVALPLWLAGYVANPQRIVRIVSESVEWMLMGFGALEALHGLGQIAGIYPSNHSLFVLTGTFYNPGPYSGYIAAILPGSPAPDVSVERKERPPFSRAVLSLTMCANTDMLCASGGYEPCSMDCFSGFVRICGSQAIP